MPYYATGSVAHSGQTAFWKCITQIADKGEHICRFPIFFPMPRKCNRILFLPVPALLSPPFFRRKRLFFSFQLPVNRFQELLHIRPDRKIHMQRRLFHLRPVNIHHNDLSLSRPGCPVIAHLPDTEPSSQRKHKICILYRKISCPIPHASTPATVKGMVVFYQIYTVPVRYHRHSKPFHRCSEFLKSA